MRERKPGTRRAAAEPYTVRSTSLAPCQTSTALARVAVRHNGPSPLQTCCRTDGGRGFRGVCAAVLDRGSEGKLADIADISGPITNVGRSASW
jgi:hypothetical protein